MTFVYPLLLGGLALAAAPVLLHFLIRKKPKLLLFPAFRFLMQKRRSNTRNLRLRHLLLLLMRIALVVLICLALARPRLLHESIGLSRERPVAMVLIFDTSESMGYKSGEVTRLDLAKKRCLELLDQLPEDGRVLILDTADPDGWPRADWLKSLEQARQRIQTLAIQSSAVPVTKGVDEGLRRFDEWDRVGSDPEGARLPRLVCVFSDRTRASWGPSSYSVGQRETPVQMLYFDVGIDEPIDVALTQLALPADRPSFNAGDRIPLRIVVKATGKKVGNAVLVLVDGKQAAEPAPFEIDADQEKALAVELDTAGLGPGMHHVEARLETAADALPFNNIRYLTFTIHEKQRVLVLADDIARTKWFASGLKGLLYDVQHQTVQGTPKLSGFDAVFLVGVAAPDDALWSALAAYLKDGGGVAIIPPGDEMKPAAYSSEKARGVVPALFGAKVDAKTGAKWAAAIDPQHSFTSLYYRWRADDWDFIRYPRSAWHYWKVGKVADAVVRYENGDPAVVARQSTGKVVLLTTTMDKRQPAWNDYDEKFTSFDLALTLMCARYLCPAHAQHAANFQFGGDPVSVEKPATANFPRYALSSGDLTEEIRFEKNTWTAGRLPRAGNYTVSGLEPDQQKTTPIGRFSINVPAHESDLTRVPAADIEAVLGSAALVPQDARTSLPDSLNWDEPIELFPWLMIGLLFLLALENLVSNRFYRPEPAAEG
jgi:hypothetical protein